MTLKVVSESRVTWATSLPILVFLGLSVLELGPMYATDRQTDRCQTDRRQTMPPPIRGGGIINLLSSAVKLTQRIVDYYPRRARSAIGVDTVLTLDVCLYVCMLVL